MMTRAEKIKIKRVRTCINRSLNDSTIAGEDRANLEGWWDALTWILEEFAIDKTIVNTK